MRLAHLQNPSFPRGPGCRCCISLRAAGRNRKRLQEKPSKGDLSRPPPPPPPPPGGAAPGVQPPPAAPGAAAAARHSLALPCLTSQPRLRGCAAAASGARPHLRRPSQPGAQVRREHKGSAARCDAGRGVVYLFSRAEPPAPLHHTACNRPLRSPPLPVPSASPPQPAAGPPPARSRPTCPQPPLRTPSPAPPVLRLVPALRSALQPREVPQPRGEMRGTHRPTYPPAFDTHWARFSLTPPPQPPADRPSKMVCGFNS
ncbi:basic proline-rich protein-like [Pseudopipra pipra]|uniref:basic proline-rich protein-like n=1 Tax=Pseudopipra pipra TaxID=415032 RepID=UPI003138B0B1